jgi:amidase
VEDAAVLLGVLAGVDPGDERTAMAEDQVRPDYTAFLDSDGLRGARIGVTRQHMGVDPAVDLVMERALATLKHSGAVLVDPADVPNLDRVGRPFVTMLHYELKANLNRYLESLGPGAPVRSLEEIIGFNRVHRDVEMVHFGQDVFLQAQEMGPLTDAAYEQARADVRQSARAEGIDWVMDRLGLDALVGPGSRPGWKMNPIQVDLPGGGSAGPAAVAGYPAVVVPMGTVSGMPVGLSLFGRAWSEPTLIRLAYAFEQATRQRRSPAYAETADDRLS